MTAAEEDEKMTGGQEQQENPLNPSKVTVTGITPQQSYGDEYRRMAGQIDTSEGALNRTSAVADIIRQGREATEYYREKAKQNDRAGRFAAWTQFASALANMAGWGGSQPIQQDTSVPLTAMRKADEYRDIMEQTGRQYSNAANTARQAEIQRRQQQLQSLLELAEKADRDAYQFGTKTATEYNPSQDERNNAMAEYYRRRAAGTGAGARSTKLSEMTPLLQFGEYGSDGKENPEWLNGKRLYPAQISQIVGRLKEAQRSSNEKVERNAGYDEYTPIEIALMGTKDIEEKISLSMDTGEIDRSSANWLYGLILSDPDYFRDILTNDEAGFRRTTMTGDASSGSGDTLSEEEAARLFGE